jgi:mono/diheme cytochrome c family protein
LIAEGVSGVRAEAGMCGRLMESLEPMNVRFDHLSCAILAAVFIVLPGLARGDEKTDDFEKRIRPLFVEKCQRCHGAEKQKGGLRFDLRDAAIKGGDTGPLFAAGKPDESLLMKAVRHDGDLKMPPDKPLNPEEIEVLKEWIARGAAWPKDAAGKPSAADHWAFQPVKAPSFPKVKDGAWARSPIDRFILAKLEAESLKPATEADRRTLIRRATYDLTGLPPTLAEVESFVKDKSTNAYEKLIDRLLASPRYGEQWGRHWLDVARYADSKGYVYGREEKYWVHAWTYRDWVIRAFNEDLPYDRFVLMQLAADLESPHDMPAQAAMGFLTIGRRFLGVSHDITDDRIDVVTRGLLGLTVTCARCHSHKFDPIPTEDYYSLYGIFRSSREKLIPIGAGAHDADFERKYAPAEAKFRSMLEKSRKEAAERVRGRVTDYLLAQFELGKYPEEGFDQNLLVDDVIPAFVRRWRDYLRGHASANDRVWAAWNSWKDPLPEGINPLVKKAFAKAPTNREEVAKRYGKLFAKIETQWQEKRKAGATELEDPAAEQLRRALYGIASPCEVPDGMLCDNDQFFPTAEIEALWKQRSLTDRILLSSPTAPPQALVMVESEEPINAPVFRRGNPAAPMSEVPHRFLTALGAKQFKTGSGRHELAKAIVDPANPLTARVIVNRVWQHHFGAGLVRTPSDFGTRAEAPSHPELLDWLAADFVQNGWSFKKLHRTLMLSATYRQSAAAPSQKDPENRWLCGMTPRRLSIEELRDSLFAMTNDLDFTTGGRAVPLFKQPFSKRRTVYGEIDREYVPAVFRSFDFANPDVHVPQRNDTTVPQQSLFFLNHPLPLERARALAANPEVAGATTLEEKATRMFRLMYQREPTAKQLAGALTLVAYAEKNATSIPRNDWAYGYARINAETNAVADFKPFSTFTGEAWQGGNSLPDRNLGWMQITAEGGHAGDKFVVVRRWISPIDGTIAIRSKLQHKPKAGDGVRGRIIGSRQGLLGSEAAFNKTVDMNVESAEVRVGDTIDFVIDHQKTIDFDEYLWTPTIIRVGTAEVWDARQQFAGPVRPLGPWEQLAQVLLMANEFSFVD